jgi:signal transduction histidine kinase
LPCEIASKKCALAKKFGFARGQVDRAVCRFQALMDPKLIQVVQMTWSRERQVVEADGACQDLFGASAAELIGRPLHTVLRITEDTAQEIDAKARGVDSGRIEFVLSRTGTGIRVLRLVLGRRGDDATAGIADLNRFLAGAPPIQISQLAYSLSHEIRNPLSSVKMAVQTVGKGASLSERDSRRLAIANREIRSIERTLWILAEYGRETPPQLELVSLRSLLEESAALVQPELAERRVELKIEDDCAARVHADSQRVRRVLSQLLLNVAMSQPEGSAVVVKIRQVGPEGCEVIILEPTTDSLPDPLAGEHPGVIEPLSSPLTRGARLSLAALYQVMKSHGGEVKAERNPTVGTQYTLRFRS